MTYAYTTEGGWDIEVEYDYHKGTTGPGGDNPTTVVIDEVSGPYGLVSCWGELKNFFKVFKIDIEDIESQIRDENL